MHHFFNRRYTFKWLFFHLVMLVFGGVSSHWHFWLGILGPGFLLYPQRLLDEWSFPNFQAFFTLKCPFLFPKPRLVCAKTLCLKATRPTCVRFQVQPESLENNLAIWMFPKIMVPPRSSICSEGFPLFSPSILGYHCFWKHPYLSHFFHFWKEKCSISFTILLSWYYLPLSCCLSKISFLKDEEQAAFKTGLWYLSRV